MVISSSELILMLLVRINNMWYVCEFCRYMHDDILACVA